MHPEHLSKTGGGESRCGYDFLYEMIGFFSTLGSLLETGPGDISGPDGSWVRAPQEFHHKENALAAFGSAADGFTRALENYSGDFVNDVFPSPVGPFTPLGMANLAVWHTMYHSGQLNYIQTMHGDVAFHWVPDNS